LLPDMESDRMPGSRLRKSMVVFRSRNSILETLYQATGTWLARFG
jgi:hypothetical protein